ncbi:hypothetical protein MTR67_028343 [Solanum verrucosum]|uniref:Uncharacterized protein n=1 Tax=Solanum verrucosum TaxID=315347 RepID=A0AAF0U0H8_SOLVR|nr:hypothetical protein MTR67_028343 [Solanum verrucosum]
MQNVAAVVEAGGRYKSPERIWLGGGLYRSQWIVEHVVTSDDVRVINIQENFNPSGCERSVKFTGGHLLDLVQELPKPVPGRREKFTMVPLLRGRGWCRRE